MINLNIKNALTAPLSTSIGVISGFLLPIALDSFSLPIIGAGILVAVIGVLLGAKKETPKPESPKDYADKLKEDFKKSGMPKYPNPPEPPKK